jgi:hypothetical protein
MIAIGIMTVATTAGGTSTTVATAITIDGSVVKQSPAHVAGLFCAGMFPQAGAERSEAHQHHIGSTPVGWR